MKCNISINTYIQPKETNPPYPPIDLRHLGGITGYLNYAFGVQKVGRSPRKKENIPILYHTFT